MKKFLGVLAAGLLMVGAVSAQETTVDAGLDVLSGYVWRGGVIGADDKVVLQPSVGLTFGESGLSAGVWGSAFAQSRGALDPADEVDFWVDYSGSLGEDSPLGFSIGFTEYLFPNAGSGAKHSEEAYVGLSLDNSLAPSLTFYYDFGLADAWYAVLSGGTDVPLGEDEDGPALSIGASVAMSDYGGKTGFNDVTGTASITLPAGQFSISPMVGVTYADDKINVDNTSFWGGVSIGISLSGE
ncbi:MAG: hypothetical protein HOE48_04235 [Candidatus Latescibacteria bacterium]|nr:hypothetical protein [Candidatus Latescibacterota bacterium]